MHASIRIPLIFLGVCAATYAVVTVAVSSAAPLSDLIRGTVMVFASTALVRVLVIRELARRDQIERSLRIQATHDPLTGLVNRAHFEEMLERARARAERTGQLFGVAYIDLNDFKLINDRYGHHAGDLVLSEVARRISAIVRAGDCAARFGGDEFVVLVDDQQDFGAARLADRLRHALRAPFMVDGQKLTLSASIGIAHYPDHGELGSNLLQAADRAMYRAKSKRKSAARVTRSNAA